MVDNEKTRFNEWDKEISRKWMRYWEEKGLYKADPVPGKKKFYLTAAYPYPNAPLHMGHGRTYLIPDVIARYKRMRGYNVLFPMAFHFTGTPILTMSEAIAKGDKDLIKEFIEVHGVPPEDIEELKTPFGMAGYFRERAREDMKKYLLSIDWRREFTTVDPEYKAFITWQFLKLKEKGYVIQGTHPVGWCPVHQSPVGMHDTKGDVEPEIQEFTLIYFEDEEGLLYPAATLRPETVYGVTNMWVNPSADYVIVEVDGKRMILSKQATFKLKFQKNNVKEIGIVKPESLLGKRVRNPITGKWVPILPSEFVDPSTGTGVVMSVPAHAPYDYAALKDVFRENIHEKYGVSRKELELLPLINLEGYTKFPARYVVEKTGIESAREKEKLDTVTKEVYLNEHNRGVMRKDILSLIDTISVGEDIVELTKEIAGQPVKEIRDKLIEWMRNKGIGDVFYEIANKPVYCRCGTEIVVKVLENQWFIDYENEEWKNKVRKALEKTTEITPPDYKQWFEHTIGWLKKRACARSRGLGTPLPWDKDWIIESLSDSTIYMAFYTVIHKIRKYKLKPEQLTKEFWDYIFLAEGSPTFVEEKTGIHKEILEELRKEFEYWYPLDNRHSGKDLVPNHLTFMLFNHTALFPQHHWPRRIVVNGHIMIEGQKMSKSLGNFIPLYKAIDKDGPNTLRLALLYSSEIGNDSNYTRELVEASSAKLQRIHSLVKTFSGENTSEAKTEDIDVTDKWLLSRIRRRIIAATKALDDYRLRDATIQVFSMIEQDIRQYLMEKKEPNRNVMDKVITTWIKMMAPFTPGFAEELWHLYKGEEADSIFTESWPSEEEYEKYPVEELTFLYIEKIMNDINNIKRVTKREPKEIVIVTASKNKWPLIPKIIKEIEAGKTTRDLTRLIARELRTIKKPHEAAQSLYELIMEIPDDLREHLKSNDVDEKEIISTGASKIIAKLNTRVRVVTEEEASDEVLKRRTPIPFKPVIEFIF